MSCTVRIGTIGYKIGTSKSCPNTDVRMCITLEVTQIGVPFSSHGPHSEKGEDKIGIGLISDTVVQTVLLDIHIIGPKYRSVSLHFLGKKTELVTEAS